MIQFLTFAGRASYDFGIHISGEALFDAPKRKYSSEKIPGRNGDLLLDEGSFENITVKYPSGIINNMPARVKEFINFAGSKAGYQRLEDTYNPDEFRLAQFAGGTKVKAEDYMNRIGTFDLEFNCKPQRFLKSGEKQIGFEAAGSIFNKTNFGSKPKIHITGSGDGTVGVGDYLITIAGLDEYMDIDCELMDATKGTLNENSKVSFNADSFFIEPGENGITFTGDIESVVITPRWFII